MVCPLYNFFNRMMRVRAAKSQGIRTRPILLGLPLNCCLMCLFLALCNSFVNIFNRSGIVVHVPTLDWLESTHSRFAISPLDGTAAPCNA